MRPIDADALEKYLSDAEIEAIKQRKYVFASALNTICGNVRNFPTIEPEPCEDAVPRTSIEYICRKNTVSTNPYEHEHHEKFIKFMDDPEIADFGRWQHSNGFNTALVAVRCDLDKVPSVQPEIIYCKDCVHHIDGFFCRQANHHTSDKDHCASVFIAERREK